MIRFLKHKGETRNRWVTPPTTSGKVKTKQVMIFETQETDTTDSTATADPTPSGNLSITHVLSLPSAAAPTATLSPPSNGLSYQSGQPRPGLGLPHVRLPILPIFWSPEAPTDDTGEPRDGKRGVCTG